ncbi:MAG: flagellar export chaperone FlgN [Chthonomonas sp.]|nr:flagellar export chaperone FlgN [Chthonomonas sp.]
MITRELQILWWDWLSSAERLVRSLGEQTTALARREPDRLDQVQPEIERLLAHLRKLDEEAVVSATKLAGELGVDPSFRSIVGALKEAEAQQVGQLATRVRSASANIKTILAKNRKLIESELAYVNGTLAIVAQAIQDDSASYVTKAKRTPALVNQVA